MKKPFYKIFAILGVTSLIFLADACLKDDRFVDFSKVGAVIEFPDALPGKAIGLDFALSDTPDTVWVRINQTGPTATDHDLEIGLGVSQAGLDFYNQDTAHVVGALLPPDAYSLPTSATIKAGITDPNVNIPNRTVTVPVLIFTKKIPTVPPGINYVLPIGLTSVPSGFTLSGNYGWILFNFYHNIYDGDYTSTMTRYNFTTSSDYTGWDPVLNKPLASSVIASSANTVFDAPITTVNATISTLHAGNDPAAFGKMNIKVNPADNTVLVISTTDTGLNALGPLVGPGAPKSTYDPVTKTFRLYYQYTNLPVAPATAGTFRVLKEKLVHN